MAAGGIGSYITQGDADGFGMADLARLREANFSDQQILQYLRGSGYSPNNYSNESSRIGPAAWSALGGAWNPSGQNTSGGTRPSGTGSSGGGGGGDTSSLLAYQRELDTYRGDLSDAQFKLSDYESQLNRYKSDLETAKTQYQDVLGKYNTSSTKIDTLGQELEKVKADSELYRSKLDSYTKDAVSQQLDVLRRGSGANQGPSMGGVNLASGGGTVTRATRPDSGVNVVAQVDATDSVLDRRGPVVETMRSSGSSSASPVQARQNSLASGRGSAAGYYASRFG